MAKSFSQNTKFENASGRAMKVEVRQDPGNFLEFEFVIPSGDHKYMCYEDLRIEYNQDRPVDVVIYLEGARELGETRILPADIRANEKLKFNFLNGAITITRTRGHFILRLGSMAKSFSRNTKLENEYVEAMKVEVRRDPGGFLESEFVIPPCDHKYMCYEELGIEYNRDRPVDVVIYLERDRGIEKYIQLAEIRANEKLKFNFLNGAITITPTGGHFFSRLGLFIKSRQAFEQIKSWWGK